MSEWRSAMKKIFNKAFASILLSSTFIVPMTSPILANEVEIQITNADEFVNHLLSVETISDGQVTYTPFKIVDDSNYLAIINSETTYNKLTGLDTNSVVNQQMINDIDTILLKNTEKTYQTFLAEAKALQQAKEQAAKEQAEQAAQAAQEQAAQQASSQTQTTQDNNTSTTTQTDTKNENVVPSTDSSKEESSSTDSNQSSQEQTENNEQSESKEQTNSETVNNQEEASKQEQTPTPQPVLNAETKIFTGSANGIRVSVYAPSGTFEEGVEMRVVPLSNQDALQDAQTALGQEVDQAVSVDISFWKDGVEVEPNGHVSVQFASDSFGQGSQVSVIHDAGNGQVTAMKTSTKDDLMISTDSFSPYTLATVKTIDTQALSSPKVVSELLQNTSSNQESDAKRVVNTSNEENLQVKAYQTLAEVQGDSEDNNTKALAFIQTYLTSSTGVVYSQATSMNAQNILNSKSAWEQLSREAKIAVNTNLNKKIKKTYNKLYLEAQSFSSQSIHTGNGTSVVSYSVMLGTSVLGVISVLKKKEKN